MKINPNSHVPIYLQLVDQIRAAIAAGVYRPGEALPSLRVLALDVQVNPNTVQRAYDTLLRQGTIYSQRGKGLYVAELAAGTALDDTQQTVVQAFAETIHVARLAGMNVKQIRELFNSALRRARGTGEVTS